MEPQFLALTTSLAGVLVGGAISYAIQRSTQRAADHIDKRRQLAVWREARRAERVTRFDSFLRAAQSVERVAIDRHHSGVPDEIWRPRADMTLDELWIQQKLIDILCPALRDFTLGFCNALHDSVHTGPGGEAVWQYLQPRRMAFLDAARLESD